MDRIKNLYPRVGVIDDPSKQELGSVQTKGIEAEYAHESFALHESNQDLLP